MSFNGICVSEDYLNLVFCDFCVDFFCDCGEINSM